MFNTQYFNTSIRKRYQRLITMGNTLEYRVSLTQSHDLFF